MVVNKLYFHFRRPAKEQETELRGQSGTDNAIRVNGIAKSK